MHMFPSSEKAFPKLLEILKVDIPAFSTKPAVIDALAHWSGWKKRGRVKSALAFGQLPRVSVERLGKLGAGDLGFTANNSTSTGAIKINAALIAILEAVSPDVLPASPLGRAAAQLRNVVIVTLLHELVHFGEHDTGTDWGIDPATGEPIEAGFEFENDAKLDKLFPDIYVRVSKKRIDMRLPMHFLRPQKMEDSVILMRRDGVYTSSDATAVYR